MHTADALRSLEAANARLILELPRVGAHVDINLFSSQQYAYELRDEK